MTKGDMISRAALLQAISEVELAVSAEDNPFAAVRYHHKRLVELVQNAPAVGTERCCDE